MLLPEILSACAGDSGGPRRARLGPFVNLQQVHDRN
jgi:hypothetical protein